MVSLRQAVNDRFGEAAQRRRALDRPVWAGSAVVISVAAPGPAAPSH